MVAAFDKLSDTEIELMHRAPLLVCILIAGADGKIDRKEMRGAILLGKKKVKGQLSEFYRSVSEDLEDKLKHVVNALPVDVRERNRRIVPELAMVNEIMPKIDKQFAKEFYGSLKYIAAKIADSSGGLLGIKSMGEEEERYVDLPMIKVPS
jgi:hypothetical protein